MSNKPGRSILMIATALTAVGCQSGQTAKVMNPKPKVGAGVAALQAQMRAAAAGQARLDAVAPAEMAVQAAPDSLEARRALAQAYFDAGRFRSAVQACDDALALAPADDGLRLRKALALLAQGNQAAALAELERVGDARDAGLAFALAGRADRGIDLLTQAAREATASARTRQNLALAYALDGQWAQARTIAAQDLDPASLEIRIRQWAEFAASADPVVQTASLLGVRPITSDEGRPIGLAYVPPAARLVQQAAVMPASPVAAVETIEVASVEPTVAPETQAAVKVALAPAAVAPAAAPTEIERLLPGRVGIAAPNVGAVMTGRWVVQLGAYDRPELLESNWRRIAQRNAELLGGYGAVRSEVTIGERRFHRLAIAGFDNRAAAIDLCETLQTKGRDCFVRSMNPSAVQLARLDGPTRA